MPKPKKITQSQMDDMIRLSSNPLGYTKRGHRKHCGNATMACNNERFVMTAYDAAAGTYAHAHSLAVDCTSLDRLNAHWAGYCARRA